MGLGRVYTHFECTPLRLRAPSPFCNTKYKQKKLTTKQFLLDNNPKGTCTKSWWETGGNVNSRSNEKERGIREDDERNKYKIQ